MGWPAPGRPIAPDFAKSFNNPHTPPSHIFSVHLQGTPRAFGLLNTNARGRRVDFYFLGELPPVVGPDKILAKLAMAAHELVAYLILALVALHAAAALFHHFVRRDDVLNAMLPGRCR